MVACWSNRLCAVVAGADGGRGGSSPFVLTLVATEDVSDTPRRPAVKVELELEESSDGVLPFISQVSGGPETCTGFGCARPTVPAWRTVPKSQRSSGSEPPFLPRRIALVVVHAGMMDG